MGYREINLVLKSFAVFLGRGKSEFQIGLGDGTGFHNLCHNLTRLENFIFVGHFAPLTLSSDTSLHLPIFNTEYRKGE